MKDNSNKIKDLISVVLSFRNEQEVLPELIGRLQKVFRSLTCDYELIFVNDDSTDNSLDLLMKHREKNNCIKIINMSRRFGIAPCVIAGFKHAEGDAVICMDTDLQDPPELIPELLEKWREGFDVVHTTRTRREGESLFKMWLTRRAYSMINFMADIDIPLNSGDFKLLSRRAVDAVLTLDEYDPFLRGLSRWVGFKQTQVYYERESRFAGETKYSLLRSSNPYREFLRGITSFSTVPLYISLFIGFTTSFFSFLLILYTIIQRFVIKEVTSGWTSIIAVNLFLGGIILTTIGIIGIYIGKIHQDVKKRPRYFFESKMGFDDE